MKKNWGTIVIVAVIIIGGTAWMKFSGGGGNGETAGAVDAVTEADWTKGNPDAKVTLIEYSDFQCPACGAYYPLLKQLTAEYSEQVRFVYRHFPLRNIHANAEAAARSAEAAGKQGKFWEMHDKLFENQAAWSGMLAALPTFESYAGELGLNLDQFRTDVADGAVGDRVNAQFNDGLSAGLNSTPSFFLNGEKIDNPRTYEQFKQVVDEALAAE